MTFYFVLVAIMLASVSAQSPEPSSGLRVHSKRQIAGGEESQDPSDPKYKKLAEESYNWYHQTHLDGKFLRRIIVTKVTKQVVNGWMYRLSFIAIASDYLGRGEETLLCNSKIWDKMVSDTPKEFTVDCHNANERLNRGKRQVVGGEEIQNPNDPEYKTLAEESYKKYLETDSLNMPRVAKKIVVTRATRQVVSGSLKRMDFVVITIYDETLICHSEVWEQPWLNKKDITVNCNVTPGPVS